MVIFNSYVSLPEGTSRWFRVLPVHIHVGWIIRFISAANAILLVKIPWHQTTVLHSKIYPLVNVYKKRWEITIFNEKINYFYGDVQ